MADGEAFPQGRARSSRRCSWCWQRALFAWGRPGEILSDHQHGHSAGRSKMQLIRENLFHPKASEQPHPCRGTAEQKASEWMARTGEQGWKKAKLFSPHTFLRCCSWLVLVKVSQKPSLMPKGSTGNCEGHQMNQLREPSPKACLMLGKNLLVLLALSYIMKYFLLHRGINQTNFHLSGFSYWNSLCTLHDFRFEEYFCSFTLPSTEDCKTYTSWKSFLFHILQKILRTFQKGIEIMAFSK